MDVSRELSSLKRRAARLAVERTVPDLEMPVYFEGEEQLRGKAHYDSHIFPYTATAIIKGKWNNLEYSSEIKELMEMYNIKSDREMYQYGPVGSV